LAQHPVDLVRRISQRTRVVRQLMNEQCRPSPRKEPKVHAQTDSWMKERCLGLLRPLTREPERIVGARKTELEVTPHCIDDALAQEIVLILEREERHSRRGYVAMVARVAWHGAVRFLRLKERIDAVSGKLPVLVVVARTVQFQRANQQ